MREDLNGFPALCCLFIHSLPAKSKPFPRPRRNRPSITASSHPDALQIFSLVREEDSVIQLGLKGKYFGRKTNPTFLAGKAVVKARGSLSQPFDIFSSRRMFSILFVISDSSWGYSMQRKYYEIFCSVVFSSLFFPTRADKAHLRLPKGALTPRRLRQRLQNN